MIEESINLGVNVSVFSPCNWKKGEFQVSSFKFTNGKWINSVITIPNIIYDRFFAEKEAEKKSIKEMREFLKKNNFNFLTSLDLVDLIQNKIKFYNFLCEVHIPTIDAVHLRNVNEDTIQSFFNYSNMIYVKPIFGAKGKGISIIEKISSKNYLIYTPTRNGTVVGQSLLEFLKSEFNETAFFIQPKAKIVDFNNSPIDVRVLVQNRGNNNYEVTGMGVRLGKKNTGISNMSIGGTGLSIFELRTFYKDHYNRDIELEIYNIEKMSLICCQKLHKIFGNYVEIGLDILLTLDKGPIVLEANSKPGRWLFNVIANSYDKSSEEFIKYKSLRKKSVILPLIFAVNNIF